MQPKRCTIGIQDEAATHEHLLDCLARWLIDHRERGRVLWGRWTDPASRTARSEAWIDDMRVRIERQKAERAARITGSDDPVSGSPDLFAQM